MKAYTRRISRLGALLLSSAMMVTGLGAVEIIAHRGESAEAPENSLAAMKLAWDQDADMIELDLWLSSDGKVIVFHDADTRRFEKTPRKISSLTLAEARRIDIGAWKGPKFAGERIPTLISILETIPKGKRAMLEIKCGPEILPELGREIRASGRLPEELVIISFSYEVLKKSKAIFPEIDHYFLNSYSRGRGGKAPELAPLIELCKAAGLDGLSLKHEWPIDAQFTAQVKSAGLKLTAWTVNDVAIAERLRSAGIDAIATDHPKLLIKEPVPK